MDKGRSGSDISIDKRARAVRTHARNRFLAGSHHQVAGQHQIRLAHGHAGVHQLARRGSQHHVGIDGAALLGQARHVQHRAALAFQMGRHADQLPNGDNASAADTGNEHAVMALDAGRARFGHARRDIPFGGQRARLAQLAALDGHEARAEPFETGEILVAAGLVDGPLATELGLQRLDRQAMRLLGTISAPFAHTLVDDYATRGIGISIALAAAPLFGGAGLVVNENGNIRVLAQFAHDAIEFITMLDRHARRQSGDALILFRLIGDDDDSLNALGRHLLRDHGHTDGTVDRLPPGHGHRVVEENFVGDGCLGGHRRPYGQQA
ncbi:hypothetical protein L573_2732 [Bordetella holmesii H620]|nr:hypothetical protein L573_2732 [Bordetella holmesii H620]